MPEEQFIEGRFELLPSSKKLFNSALSLLISQQTSSTAINFSGPMAFFLIQHLPEILMSKVGFKKKTK